MIRALFSIARYTIVEQIRNRLYLIILFFGGAMLSASILLGALAPEHQVRVIFDLGLVTIELFGLVTAVFGAVTLVLQEIESRTIYLILTRPLPRWIYIVGRFLGLVSAVAMAMTAMALLHLGVMAVKPLELKIFLTTVDLAAVYPVVFLMTLEKMAITTAIALFFSLFATSSVSALVFTGCFWVAGHFGTELAFMIQERFDGWAHVVARKVSLVLPNFQYLNARDTFAFPDFSLFGFVGTATLYTIGYAGFFIVLSALWFSRKEF